MLGHKSWQHA